MSRIPILRVLVRNLFKPENLYMSGMALESELSPCFPRGLAGIREGDARIRRADREVIDSKEIFVVYPADCIVTVPRSMVPRPRNG